MSFKQLHNNILQHQFNSTISAEDVGNDKGETVGNRIEREPAPDGAKELFKRWKIFSAAPAGALKLLPD